MLGDITPQSIQIDQQAVVYPGRDHVTVLTIKRFDGRRYQSVDVSLLTRVVLAFPGTDPVIVYDSSVTAGVISWAGSAITVDLSDFSMPASIQPCYLIAYDAEHTNGQVLVDNNDSVLAFDFRNVSAVGIVQPPVIELISEAPADGATYGRKNGTWVGIDAVVAGVSSVNGLTGVVVLNTDNIAEGVTNLYFTNGRASDAAPVQTVDGQTGAVVLTSSYAPLSHVGDTGAAHGAATTLVNGFMSSADKTKLDGVATSANNYVHPNHSGDVTSVGDGVQTIAANAVTNAKAADMAVNTIKGRITAGTGDPEDLTATQVRTIINVADGANAYVHPNHSGDVTSVGDGAQTIAANAVTNTKLADMATQTLKGRTTAGTGDPEDLTATQVRALLNVANGATALPAVATFTGNKTLALADINTYNVSQDATAQVVTLPAQATVSWTADAEIHVERGGTGSLTVTGATGVTINGVSAGSFTLSAQFAAATLKRKGPDSWTLVGGLTSSVVTGPASSGDGNIALFNGTTGKVIKDGGTVTAAGLALLDDASASAQRTTLGVGTGDSPTFASLALTNGQIAFPATQVPSANANTLDDYEEGTWTPVLTFATPGDLSVAYSVSAGFYTKTGREVCIRFTVVTSTFTHTTASGNFLVTGAPFTSISTPSSASTGPLSFQGINKAGYSQFNASLVANSSAIEFLACESGSNRATIGSADMPTGGSVILQSTFNYIAA